MSATISATIDQPLLERLEDEPNKSEVIRQALRDYYEDTTLEMELPDREESAYRELLTLTRGGGLLRKKVAETVLAQVVGLQKSVIRPAIFDPLNQAGLIEPVQTWEAVYIRVYSPEEVEDIV